MCHRPVKKKEKNKISLRKIGGKETTVNNYQGLGNGCKRRFPATEDVPLRMEAHMIKKNV